MARENKFRAWHKAEKIICEVDVLTHNGAFLIGVKNGPDELTNGGKMIIISPKNGRFCMNDEFELIQFTGYKDKNGVDIYEKHIIDISKFDGSSIWRLVINDIRQLPNEMFGSNVDWIKVVGNTFENIELLNN